jgi:hypothetical protein
MTVREMNARGITPEQQVICHQDGTMTYWSQHRQRWLEGYRTITAEDLAALPTREQGRVRRHLKRHGS